MAAQLGIVSRRNRRSTTTLLVALATIWTFPLVRADDVDFPPTSPTPLVEIHGMHRKEAAMQLPIKVRGVVTLTRGPGRQPFTIEDEEAGVYVAPHEDATPPPFLKAGDLVEVTGVTGPGAYAPLIHFQRVDLLGTAPLPTAQPVTLSSLLTGRFDSRRVEVRGVVQHAAANPDTGRFSMEVVGEFGRITVFAPPSDVDPDAFINAGVTVQGVCFLLFNERAQVAGTRIELNSTDEIVVTRPPDPDPFSAPLIALDELQAFSPDGANFHRQRIRATVTLVKSGDYIYVQNDTQSVRINLAGEVDVRPGDRIEAVGFTRPGVRFVELHHALVRKIGDGPVPHPIATTRAKVLDLMYPLADRATGDFDGRLISLTGRLDGIESLENDERQLFIDCGGQVVSALLATAEGGDAIDHLSVGSTVRITGVCQVNYTENWPNPVQARPAEMRLLLRDTNDITVVRSASWWTPTRLRVALGVVGAILLAALPWLRSLRRQIGERTKELASETRARQDAEIEFHATLRERERVSADMHDTVEQALTGVSYQLAVAERLQDSDPERGRHHLTLAGQLLSQSREEVRRSVWNLRAQTLDGRPLAEVLRDIAAGLCANHDLDIDVRVTGPETEIPERLAGHILLLAQESMTNALKHAHPKRIHLTLAFADHAVELLVTDDGCGFDPATAPGMGEGHMGLQGMRERAKRLGGTLRIDSTPGEGTTIRAKIPLEE